MLENDKLEKNQSEKMTLEEVNHNLRSWLLILSIVTGLLFLCLIFLGVRTMAEEQKMQAQQENLTAALEEVVIWSSDNFNFVALMLEELATPTAADNASDAAAVFVEEDYILETPATSVANETVN
ncbi:MAG: hypothetical protein Q4G02_01460 [bacterium]|nr:hypothetical protein [bacterium]